MTNPYGDGDAAGRITAPAHAAGQAAPRAAATDQIRTASRWLGEMEVFTAWPERSGPIPAVVVLMDMWGFREVVCDVVRQVAALGYCAMLPDVYHRTDPVRLDREVPRGSYGKFGELPAGVQKRLRSAMDSLRDDDVVADFASLMGAATRWGVPLAAHVGLVGYCMGGRHALCIAGAFPDRVRASACLHGAGLVGEGDASPHRRALRGRGEIYCGHAELDEYASKDVAEQLRDLLPRGGAAYMDRVHRGAHHGYALRDRAIFDADATARDWAAIEAMFRRQLQAPAGG